MLALIDSLEVSAGAPADFPFAEKLVCKKMGVPKGDMRALRRAKLEEGDFTIYKKALYLSRGAVEKLFAVPGVVSEKSRPAQSGAIPGPVQAVPAKVVRLLIVRADLPNRHMLSACPVNEDPDQPRTLLRVRVRSQEGFRIRTVIEGRLVPGFDDMYDLVSRYPRKRKQGGKADPS